MRIHQYIIGYHLRDEWEVLTYPVNTSQALLLQWSAEELNHFQELGNNRDAARERREERVEDLRQRGRAVGVLRRRVEFPQDLHEAEEMMCMIHLLINLAIS